MIGRSIFFCVLALSLALISLSMAPSRSNPPSAMRVAAGQPTPIHSLTGVSFHSVAGY